MEEVEQQDVALDNNEEAESGESKSQEIDYKAEAAKWKRIAERNAKKAEKTEEAPKAEVKSDPSELDHGQKALLRSMGIKGADELQLAKDFMKRTGQDIDSLESDDIFQAKLTKLRDTKANEAAAEGKTGRGTQASDPVAKILATLGKNDPIPADLPREVREKLVDARRAQSKESKQFYND